MKAEQLFEAIGEVGDDLLEKSEKKRTETDTAAPVIETVKGTASGKTTAKPWIRILVKAAPFVAAAAVLILVISVGRSFFRMGNSKDTAAGGAYQSEAAMAAEAAAEEEMAEAMAEEGVVEGGTEEAATADGAAPESAEAESPASGNGADAGYAETLSFAKTCAETILAGGTENTVISPLNLYLAAAMLAEATDGSTRQEILTALGVSDMEELRENALSLAGKAAYRTDGGTSITASSLWMDNDRVYEEAALEALAAYYSAEGYTGEMGSDALNKALQNWINQKTEGLLSDSVKNLALDGNTALALVATLYYKAAWEEAFPDSRTEEEVFHAADGDVTVPMMHGVIIGVLFYETDTYTAAALPLRDGKQMWFFLPKEGVSADSLLTDTCVYETIAGRKNQEAVLSWLDAAVPKFDITQETDLIEALPELGIREAVFGGDYSALVRGGENLMLSTALHSVRIAADEDGVTGAAYTIFAAEDGAAAGEERTLVLDKPFVFALSDVEGDLWFFGKVEKP